MIFYIFFRKLINISAQTTTVHLKGIRSFNTIWDIVVGTVATTMMEALNLILFLSSQNNILIGCFGIKM